MVKRKQRGIANIKMTLLTKSKYMNGLQCTRLMWFANKKLLPEITLSDEHKFSQGHDFEEYVKKLYPDSMDLNGLNFKENLEKTKQAVKNKKTVFEAGFMIDNLFVRLDLIIPSEDGWDLYEIKSTTKSKPQHIPDLAFQKYVLEKSGLKINKCFLIYINNEYVKNGEVDPKELIITEEVTEKVNLVDDVDINFNNKNIICIGTILGRTCNDQYTLEQLQQKYVDETNTDKIILVNPSLEIFQSDIKNTLIEGNSISQLFGKTSLSAPILASGKHEIILSTTSIDYQSVDNFIENKINDLNINPQYLTILASPLEIQQTIKFLREGDIDEVTWSIDNTKYGNIDNDEFGFTELKTGRIYGFSIGDVSAYLARDLFFDRLSRSDEFLFIGQGVGATDKNSESLSTIFDNLGFNSDYRTYSNPTLPNDWANKMLINNDAHGSMYGTTILTEQIPFLKNSIIFTASCLTCDFDKLTTSNYGRLFCLELLRKGSLGAIVSVDTAGFNWDSIRLNNILSKDIGTTFKKMQNFDHARSKWYIEDLVHKDDYTDIQADIQFLLGDPTLKIPFNKVILPDVQQHITYTPSAISINVTIPSMNVENNNMIYTFIEGTDHFPQAKYAHFFLKIGPVNLFENYSVESEDVHPIFYGGIKDVAVQKEKDGNYIYFFIEKDLSSNSLNTVINNNINIIITKE